MTNKERAELIQNAIRDYKAAKESGDAQKIRHAVNDMENTFAAVCLWGVPGTEELRQMILSAKEDNGRRMSYQIITYSPDTGGDEHGDYRTQREARQALKQYRQEAGALIYDLDRWRIVYRRGYWPAGALPIERGCSAGR